MASYTSQHMILAGLLREARYLYRNHTRHIPETVQTILSELRSVESLLQQEYSFELRDRDILDIGAGQFLPQMYYFARCNRVTGIDFDVIAQGSNPLQYVRMLYTNGAKRTGKTIIRKIVGIDHRYRLEMKAQLGMNAFPRCRVVRMDACNMSFPANKFDFVHSFSALHHLRDPGRAIEGIKRVLRPGGITYFSFQLFTSEGGSLNPTRPVDDQGQPLLWPHLRPSSKSQLQVTTYVNGIRLSEWRELFKQELPQARIFLTHTQNAGAERQVRDLQAKGELTDYSLEELITHRVRVLWKKP